MRHIWGLVCQHLFIWKSVLTSWGERESKTVEWKRKKLRMIHLILEDFGDHFVLYFFYVLEQLKSFWKQEQCCKIHNGFKCIYNYICVVWNNMVVSMDNQKKWFINAKRRINSPQWGQRSEVTVKYRTEPPLDLVGIYNLPVRHFNQGQDPVRWKMEEKTYLSRIPLEGQTWWRRPGCPSCCRPRWQSEAHRWVWLTGTERAYWLLGCHQHVRRSRTGRTLRQIWEHNNLEKR